MNSSFAAEVPTPDLVPGKLFHSRYQIVRQLGSRPMSVTLQALDLELQGEPIVLKVFERNILRTDEDVKKLHRAVLTARQLSYKHIVRTFDFEKTASGTCIIAMEYVEGQNLRKLLDSGRSLLPAEVAVRLLYQIARGLAYAHRKKVLHLDLKPENILISRAGELKISDFGISRSLEAELGLTRTGDAVTAAAYMAPEQFKLNAPSAASDVYAFGILCYELLTGRLPIQGESFYALAEQHLTAELPPLSQFRSDIPRWFVELIERCVRKDPVERFPDAVALAEVFATEGATLLEGSEESYTKFMTRELRAKRASFRRELVLMLCVALFFISMGAIQEKERALLGVALLRLESTLGVPLTWPKALLSVRGTLGDMESIVQIVRDSDDRALRIIMQADGEAIRKYPFDPPIYHQATDLKLHDMIKPLANVGFDIDARDRTGSTALLHAIRKRQPRVAQMLILLRADPNIADKAGETPLMLAVKGFDMAMAEKLLQHNANSNVLTPDGLPLLHHAVRSRSYELTALLLSHKADPNARAHLGRSVLHEAVSEPRLVALLLSRKSDIHARDAMGRTPLFPAAGGGHLESIKLLLAAGADPRARDQEGMTPADYARSSNRPAAEAILRAATERGERLQ